MNINNNSCNNRNNSSCNNNHSSSFSDLFYKVIHNKYLFNLIFNHIHSRYDNYNQTRFEILSNDTENIFRIIERIKFKDIVSLKFMVKNKLYQLLKCKLEANEYINVEVGNNKCWLNNIYHHDRELSIEIVKLLLKSTSISNPDAIFTDIHLLNPELIQVATDPLSPYSIQVQPRMIEKAFKHSIIPQIKALLDSFVSLNNNNCTLSSSSQPSPSPLPPPSTTSSEYINQFKNKIVCMAASVDDPFQRDRALELILSNPKYYSKPPSVARSSSTITTINNIDYNVDIQLISIQDIVFGIVSVDIQNQLFALNYYYIPESLSAYTDEINNIINNSSNNQLKYKRSKELYNKSYLREKLFRKPLLENMADWFHNLEKLQLIVSNNQDDWRGWNTEIEQYIYSINLHQSEEHIKYYQSLKQIQELNHINQYIDNRASVQLSQPSIYYNRNNNTQLNRNKKLNLKHSNITRLNSHINSSSSNNNNNSSQESLELDIDTVITSINNYSESGSVMEVYNTLSSLVALQYESNSITTASNQINFGSIDSYQQDQHGGINSYSQQSIPLIILICWIKVFIISIKLGSNNKITLLLKLNFNPIIQHHQLFKKLWNSKHLPIKINDDIPVFYKKDNKDGVIQFNTQIFKQSKEYRQRDPNGMVEIIKVLLDNYQQHQQVIIAIQQHQQHLITIIKGPLLQNDDDKEIKNYLEYHKYANDQIGLVSKLSAPDLVINYLFRMLIQSNGEIQLDTIKSTYKLINDSNIIKVQQSTLFSIYYLSLKSKYFIKYIATSRSLLDFHHIYSRFSIYCLDTTQGFLKEEYNGHYFQLTKFDYAKFFDPKEFSFEFVLNNNSFIDILKALVDRYMVKSFKSKANNDDILKLNQLVNHSLSFLLEVREFGLFFHYLEQLKNHDTNYFNQHIQFTDSLFKSMVLSDNQDAFYKLLKEYQPQFDQLLDKNIILKYYNEINRIIPITKVQINETVLTYSDVVIRIHPFLFGDNKITDYEFGSIDFKFKYYSIDHYKLLVNQYPNNPVFKLSKRSIIGLIESSSIIKLKQFYQNQLINDQPSNNDQYDKLLSYVKSQFKQLNINCSWLNN